MNITKAKTCVDGIIYTMYSNGKLVDFQFISTGETKEVYEKVQKEIIKHNAG